MYRIGFIVEQALGHITHGQNLQANVAKDETIAASWGLPAWQASAIPLYKSNWTVQAGLQTRKLVGKMQRQEPLDALFFHTQVTAVLAANYVKKIPSVISLDATPKQYDELGDYYAHDAGPAWLENVKWKLNRNVFRAAKHIVTWSDWAKEGLIAEYEVPAAKISVIPPGVNTQEWASPQPRQDGPVKVLFVGGNLERKGGLLLLEAFRSLRQNHGAVNLELHLVTKDEMPPESGLFVYKDMQPNSASLKRLYHSCDIFCLPTYGDCLPMVLSEAGAAGLPAVSTQVAAIPEVVRDGESGFIVPAGDVDALATALLNLIRNKELRLGLGERAVELIQQAYDAERNAVRLLTLLKQTADGAKS
ncbi:MAG: glycosyltransferase family 4 protein [Chloroflexi bacterium]|nr:glycosyltransferase family 4 protein [Chloroflexota bacterium]